MSTQAESFETESEESYFISMTDIMVGMVFVFIILLMYFVFRIQNTNDPVVPLSTYRTVMQDRDDLSSKVRELQKEIAQLRRNPLEKYLQAADATREQILTSLQLSIKHAAPVKDGDVRVIPDQGILRLSGDMLFPQGRSTFIPGSASDAAVKAVSGALANVLPCFSLGPASRPTKNCNPEAIFIDAVFVEGHTDNVPIVGTLEGGVTDNLTLSARRATNTEEAIYAYQPALKQMFSISPSQDGRELGQGNSPLINAAAFGDTRPAQPNDTIDGQRSNRRIDLRLLMYSPRSDNLDRVRNLLDR